MRRTGLAASLAALVLTGCTAYETTGDATTIDCEELADNAVDVSEGDLLKVRNPQVTRDNRETYELPAGSGETLVLACEGLGVWSEGGNVRTRLRMTVDADGDSFVEYQELP